MTYFSTIGQKFPLSQFFLISRFIFYFYMFVPVFAICFSVLPKDHNENKVYLDLYYAIPATVSLDVEFLDLF